MKQNTVSYFQVAPMNISGLIKSLKKVKEEFGDVVVFRTSHEYGAAQITTVYFPKMYLPNIDGVVLG